MRTDSIWSPFARANGILVSAGEDTVLKRRPLWLWWNLLSLDAPTIAYLWASLFMHALRTPVRDWEIVALVGAVWIIYAGDRILDGLRKPTSVLLPERHIFYSQHVRAILAVLLPLALVTSWIGLARLGSPARLTGLVMSSAVIFYFVAIHASPVRAGRWFPKEIAAGAIFAVGTALPAWIHGAESRSALLPETLLFAGLCVLNCVAIECWEHNRGNRRWETKPYWLIRWADKRIAQIAVILFFCSAWSGIFVSHRGRSADLAVALAISLLVVLAIERHSNTLSRQALRVLADAALLTPLAFLLRWVR